jgi:hypothetical protein
MTTGTIEKLVWVLIYGGLLLVGLGLFVRPGDVGLGWTLIILGAVIAVAGTVLIAVRARMNPTDTDRKQELP